MFYKSILEINLNRVSQNYRQVKSYLKNVTCGAVIKANAYGLGMVEVAKKLYADGCRHYFVAHLNEAMLAREHLKNCDVYILHGISSLEEARIVDNMNLIPVIGDLAQIEILNGYAKSLYKKLPAVLHFDTGMARFELQSQDALKISNNWELISNLEIKYIMSHLACPDEPAHPANQKQLNEMRKYQKLFPNFPISFANSAALLLGEDYHFNLVRPGAALYGIYTHKIMNGCDSTPPPFLQVATLYAYIIQKKIIERSCSIGYGATFVAKPGDKLLTLECGYADGYFRSLGNIGYGYYNGKKLPIVGIISMDSIVVNATSLTDREFNAIKYVELFGDNITVNEVAESAGTIGYEVLTSLGNRFQKIFKDQN